MQEHSLQACALLSSVQAFVQVKVAVFVVADDRKAEMREVDPDLMRAPGTQLHVQQRIGAYTLPETDDRMRRRPFGIDGHASLSTRGDELAQRRANMLARIGPATTHQGKVAFLDPS